MTLEQPDENDTDGLCTLLVALMQKNRRTRQNRGTDYLTIGFNIYRVTEHDIVDRPLSMKFFRNNKPFSPSPAFTKLREVCESIDAKLNIIHFNVLIPL